MTCASRTALPRVLVVLASAVGTTALGVACTSEEIVLAHLPPPPDAGVPSENKRCVDATDCSATAFCAHKACDDVAGTCEALPVVCDEAPMPVCGCDGVTYWNDCLRRAAGIAAMTPGECAEAARVCRGAQKGGHGGFGPDDDCPAGAFCARLLPSMPIGTPTGGCPSDVPGTCWALPAVCPERGGPDRWTACEPGAIGCTSTCEAIRTGRPHRRAMACP
jgi:hypothetical protein